MSKQLLKQNKTAARRPAAVLPSARRISPAHGQLWPAANPRLASPAHFLQLQRAAGNRAVGRLLTLPGRGPIVQRTLGVRNKLNKNDVTAITKVAAKVWILTGHNNDSVVIKVELPSGTENVEDLAARQEYITHLGKSLLSDMPDSQRLTDGEIGELAQLTLPEGGNQSGPTLRQVAQDVGQFPVVFLKVERVSMGENLEDKIRDVRNSSQPAEKQQKHQDLLNLITNPTTLKRLGRMAVLDLLVNNQDRFFPSIDPKERIVNVTNIDFTQTNQVIAIDNLDPNNRIERDKWIGASLLKERKMRVVYATNAVRYLLQAAQFEFHTQQSSYIKNFLQGMNDAVTELKNFVGPLEYMILTETTPKRKEIASILRDRIKSLQE